MRASEASAPEWWAQRVADYDAFIRRVVPPYDLIIRRLIEYLPPGGERILELGCGTGNLSVALAASQPHARFTFVDAVPEMIDATQARLDAAQPDAAARSRFEVARFEELRPEAGAYDRIVSALALHHVRDKRPLFQALRHGLAPGGTLSIADGLAGASRHNQAVIWESYVGPWQDGRCTPQEICELLEHAEQHDHYVSLIGHFEMLQAAGFVNLDCVWREGIWTVITGETE